MGPADRVARPALLGDVPGEIHGRPDVDVPRAASRCCCGVGDLELLVSEVTAGPVRWRQRQTDAWQRIHVDG